MAMGNAVIGEGPSNELKFDHARFQKKKNNETALANFVEETMATVDTFGACVVLMHINILIIMRLFWDF